MQIQYAFYMETYGGTQLPEHDWERLSQKALQRLKQFTFGRIPENWEGQPWENQAKCAVCEMAELIDLQETRQGKTREEVDGYSVTFAIEKEQDRKLYDVAYIYLGHTGMMDFGVDT